jgi:NAD(P)-dependent dehydrogenase (short-subunit alcohol dehydrogenase family)
MEQRQHQTFRSDKEALKQKLIDEMKAAGEKPTPVKVEKQLFAIERSEAALRAIEAVEAAGGVAFYHRVNLLDSEAISEIIADVRERYGCIDVLLHAGGWRSADHWRTKSHRNSIWSLT